MKIEFIKITTRQAIKQLAEQKIGRAVTHKELMRIIDEMASKDKVDNSWIEEAVTKMITENKL